MFGRTVNALISPLGLRISRKKQPPTVPFTRYEETVSQTEALARHELFPMIPANPTRIPLMCKLLGTQIVESLYLLNELHQAIKCPGDICEFGIAQGSTSTLMANEIRHTQKNLWLFDSFEGLPRPTEKDVLIHDIFNLGSMEKYQGTMASGQESVLGRMKDISFDLNRVKLVPGFIEKTCNLADLPQEVCFAYVDFDFYEPILIALNMLANRLPVGGRVVVDDYGFFSAGAQAAVDEFVAANKAKFGFKAPPEGAGHFAMLEKLS